MKGETARVLCCMTIKKKPVLGGRADLFGGGERERFESEPGGRRVLVGSITKREKGTSQTGAHKRG